MNKEELEALKVLKGLEFEEYDWYVMTDSFSGHAGEVVEKVEKAIKTILNLIENQQKEIEKLKSRKYMFNAKTQEIKEIPIDDNYISKYKILKKLEDIRKEYNNIISKDNISLDFKNINSYRFDAMSQVLEELLKGI